MLLKRNIITTILLQTLSKTSKILAESKEDELISLLKNTFVFANETIENAGAIYKDLSIKEAENEIETLDSLYFMLDKAKNMLFTVLTENEKETIQPEYSRLINNMENIREGLELYLNEDFIQSIDEISKGEYSNFVRIAY